MIAVLQRVAEARVEVAGEVVGAIGKGLLVLAGVARGDGDDDAIALADRITGLRVFEDAAGKMNLSLLDLGLEALVVSQFTLLADVRRGRRPGFDGAERPERASALVDRLGAEIAARGVRIARGRFGAEMRVALVNEGPATFLLDSLHHRKPGPRGGAPS